MRTVIECPECSEFMLLKYSESTDDAYLGCECGEYLRIMRQYRKYPPEELLEILDEDMII
jgi:ssDNA-binding Zn-finger/Zn-ribbon topoisomerase 1